MGHRAGQSLGSQTVADELSGEGIFQVGEDWKCNQQMPEPGLDVKNFLDLMCEKK